MKKTERLNGIIYALKERGKMTASELAELFEVSLRTIYRDIDALGQLKVPIYTYEGVHGGYEIDMKYFMPSIRLTQDEIIMLLMVLAYGERIKMPGLTGDYQILKGKVIHALTDIDQDKIEKLMKHIVFSSHRVEPGHYETDVLKPILESFLNACNLEMAYYNPRRDSYAFRKISPQTLFFEEGGWYLSAYCHLREEKRIFRLDRIRSLKVNAQENHYLDKDIVSSSDKFTVTHYVLSIEAPLYRVLKDNDYFSNVVVLTDEEGLEAGYKKTDSNCIFIKFSTRYKEDILNIVLNNPQAITLIAPHEFKAEVMEKAKALFVKYV